MNNLKLSIDLLPKGAWGRDLSKTLPQKDWDTLRNYCYQKARHRCEICGKEGEDLNAHELWKFDIANKTQTLIGIVALCNACHGVKHFRNSERIGYGEKAKRHFMRVNQCNEITFASHYMEAQLVFEERNSVVRWKQYVDLSKFGGNGIEYTPVEIPLIESPYVDIDWAIVRHTRSNKQISLQVLEGIKEIVEIVELNTVEETNYIGDDVVLNNAIYFVPSRNSDSCELFYLPPKLCSIEVDNYAGTIEVVADRTNKIQWILDGSMIDTKFNIAGQFKTIFSVKNLTGKSLSFCLIGSGGKTYSLPFNLVAQDICSD